MTSTGQWGDKTEVDLQLEYFVQMGDREQEVKAAQ